MVKKVLLLFFIVLLGFLFFRPLVIDSYYSNDLVKSRLKEGELFSIEQLLKPNKGNYKAYIILANSERKELHPNISTHKTLKTTNQALIKDLLRIKFKSTGGDVATVESRLILYADNQIIFNSGVVLDKYVNGLQNNNTGWAEVMDRQKFVEICSKFRPYYMPILVLN